MKLSSKTEIVDSGLTLDNLVQLYKHLSFRKQRIDEDPVLYKLRKHRYEKCFLILDNRNLFWYNDLSDEQYRELKRWRQAWLDVTDTHIEPETPSWINDKLEGEEIL